jgi:hypothetical protein
MEYFGNLVTDNKSGEEATTADRSGMNDDCLKAWTDTATGAVLFNYFSRMWHTRNENG